MEHMILAADPVFGVPKIPYICKSRYDHLGFSGYPQRRGWDKKRLHDGDFTEHPKEQTAAFLQEWLYFGVLSEILGPDILKIDEFIVTQASGEKIVDSSSLPNKVWLWQRALFRKYHNPINWSQQDTTVKVCFEEASYFSRMISKILYHSNGKEGPVSPEIALSFQCISEAIYEYGGLRVTLVLETYNFGDPWLVESWLRRLGWCPNDIHRLIENARRNSYDIHGGLSDMLCASTLRRNPNNLWHTDCTDQICFANQINNSTYKTRHTGDGECGCSHVKVAIEEVIKILQNGEVPILKVRNSKEGSLEIKVRAARVGISYTAFSHVWSDGLGNAKENSLPTCQLLRLQALAANMKPGYSISKDHFWLDTLCVPIESAYKKVAIARMRQTYAGAESVLVLDSELLSITSAGLSARERFLRILVSGYMRRVWTLQEAALGIKNLWVQWADGPRRMNNYDRPDEGDEFYMSRFFGHLLEIDEAYQSSKGFLNTTLGVPKNIMEKFMGRKEDPRCIGAEAALRLLAGRTTTKPRDELLCIAGTIGLDESQISMLYDASDETRMKLFYSFFHALPKEWLFKTGTKLNDPGFRWICASLRQEPAWETRMQAPFYGEEGIGLEVKFSGFLLQCGISAGQDFWFICDNKNYEVLFTDDSSPPSAWEGTTYLADSRFAIITKTTPKRQKPTRAVLVSIYHPSSKLKVGSRFKKGAIFTQYISLVSVVVIAEVDTHSTNHEEVENQLHPFPATLQKDAIWYVG